MTNLERFTMELEKAYTVLFQQPDYAMTASRYTPGEWAAKMAIGLWNGQANKDGKGIRMACKACGIKQNYKAICEFFDQTKEV